MKRLCLLDLLVIMSSFLALLNHHSFLAMMIMLAGVISIYILLKDTTYTVFTLVFTISLLMISLLGIMGDLDKLYQGFAVYAILFSFNLGLLCEYLYHRASLASLIKPFFSFVISAVIILLVILLSNNYINYDLIYPEGIFTLLAIVLMIFAPYLLSTSLLFIFHERS